MLVDDEQVKRYNNSENAKNAAAIFETLSKFPNYQLKQREYCLIRDHLYTKIHFTSAPRSGVTSNMTIAEFKSSELQEDGKWLVEVWDHKTVEHYGPAKVILTAENYELLKIYVIRARPQTSPKFENVFVTWSGSKINSGDVSKRLHLAWKKAGNFENKEVPKNLTVNIIRKSTSTGLRENKSKFTAEVANLMAHSKSTAEDHYYIRNMRKSASIGTNVVTDLFYGSDYHDKNRPITTTPDKTATPQSVCTPTSQNQRKLWSEKEVSEIETAFKNEEISYGFVKKKCETLSSIDASPRQAYDKLRVLSKVKRSPSQRRCLFSESNLDVLVSRGKKLIKGGKLTEDRVDECFDGTGLLEKYSFSQIRTRLSYERTKKNKKSKRKVS